MVWFIIYGTGFLTGFLCGTSSLIKNKKNEKNS